MSKQQLAAILEMSAQNPIPANATPAVMRAWVEDFAGHLPVAENVQIERVNSQIGTPHWHGTTRRPIKPCLMSATPLLTAASDLSARIFGTRVMQRSGARRV